MNSRGVRIAGSYQSDDARNYAREGLEISDMIVEARTFATLNIGGSLTTTVSFVVTGED